MEKKENNIDKATIINGVVLTDKALNYLKGLQEDGNGMIKDIREEINNSISILIGASEYLMEEDAEEAMRLIKFLNDFNKDIKKLMKPNYFSICYICVVLTAIEWRT
jgi:hypothetical protein